jgi:hypothetical protein
MDTMRGFARRYRSLGMALALVIAVSVALTSCGGGDGDADGGLCSQCGDDPDGPCLTSVQVDRDPDAPDPCNVPGDSGCTVELACFRKLGSAQRRCFPLIPGTSDPQPQFKCDGERANSSTPRPSSTPTLTTSSTPAPTNTNASTATPLTG